jgi:ABC-2 type transport system ATP-binding protein
MDQLATAVEVSGVTKQYPKAPKPAVSNLSFAFPKGAIFGLLGPNGAGKSTLISMLCGLLKPEHGSISVLGINAVSHGTEVRKKVGVAPQEIALYPTLTALENLQYFSKMYGINGTEGRSRIYQYLETFGLSQNKGKQVKFFSGGMKRRLNLIAALLHQPELLILDEPTSGVDVQSRNMILDFLLDLQKTGVTVMYSSHYLEEAERICSNLIIIDEGKLIVEGSPSALLQANPGCQNLVDVFLKLTGKDIRD